MNSYIKKFNLINYRTYKNNSFIFQPNINIIYGKNGIGKTNILEALSFLSVGKGFLNSNIDEIISINKDNLYNNWSIYAEIENNYDYDNISVYSELENEFFKKKIKINNNLIKNQNELYKVFNIIYLIPQMQNLFIQDKSERRKFLDKIVYLIDSNHLNKITKYEFLLKERMKVLQNEKNFDERWLNVLETKIAEIGVTIANSRNNTIAYLNKILFEYNFNFPKFIILIDGKIELMLLNKITSLEAENKFKEILKNNRNEDKENKRTNEGIHKTDFKLFYEDKKIDAQYSSTGEQKLFLISLTILKVLLCKELNKSTPLILLDEVFSYLDKNKKNELFNELLKLNYQTFITTTDISIFEDIITNNKDKINLIELKTQS